MSGFEATLELPADATLPTIHGKWERTEGGGISATYTKDELAMCLWLANIWDESGRSPRRESAPGRQREQSLL